MMVAALNPGSDGVRGDDAPPRYAVSLSDARRIRRLPSDRSMGEWLASLDGRHPGLQLAPDTAQVSFLYFGSEFCERLLPEVRELSRALETAARLGVCLVFAIPMLSDRGLAQVRRLLPLLPSASEVVANDLGTLRLLQREFSELSARAGRMLCKVIKDPRLPDEDWARLYPPGATAQPFAALLRRLGVVAMELDAAPFARAEDFAGLAFECAVHVPFGYSVKGRICRPGSMHQAGFLKFSPDHECNRECLVYRGAMRRRSAGRKELHTFQRGNTLFYRHSPDMQKSIGEALAGKFVQRIVVAGDWHESHRTH